ncbi:RNA polymerase factor sigma-32 [Arenibaculum pallidiluteum]|uniref:RNA polymerase factor sigma-32 n=1 Tax=Arenibaculum pallidiluteum TaxID=2812559 RepID=UPI001A957862|nr:RNA polymerase factor sigma-32 [Arenibaculum pallidiluteum]
MQRFNDDMVSRQFQVANKYDYLSAEEERELVRRWRTENDQKALDRLLGAHLRLVFKVARKYAGYGLPVEELVSEGNVGLMQAAQKFDPEKGFRFNTYALWWVKAAIQEHVLHNWSMVKIGTTAAQKKLFFNLRRLKGQMAELEGGDLSPEAVASIAVDLDVPEAEVIEMNRRLAANDASLNVRMGEDQDNEWQDTLADERASQEVRFGDAEELKQRQGHLREALDRLPERDREILIARRLRDEPITLEELSQRYSISRERVRQLENRAFDKVQKAVLTGAKAQQAAAVRAIEMHRAA